MLIERDKVYLTRGGERRRVVCTDAPGPYPIIAVPADTKQYGVCTYTSNGHARGDDVDSDSDLMAPAPVKREGWVAEFKAITASGHIVSEEVFTSKEHAESETFGAVAIVKIEWEETP